MKRILVLLFAAAFVTGALAGTDVKDPQEIGNRNGPPAFTPMYGTWCSTPNIPIPDDDAGAAVDTMTIGETETVEDLDVAVQIQHTWVGDLRAELSHAGGCTVQLWHRIGLDDDTCCGCSSDDMDVILDDEADVLIEYATCNTTPPAIVGSYRPGDDTPNGIWPTALADCKGESMEGDWTITVTDGAAGDLGTLLQWCLTNAPQGDGGDGGDGGDVPAVGPFGLLLMVVAIGGGSAYVIARRRRS
jgi:subtilisin-like proprotein convertase family protein